MLNEAKATFFGKITKVESGEGNRRYMRLTMPINKSWMDGDERKEKTSWIEAVVFRPKLIDALERLGLEGRYARIQAEISTAPREIEGKKVSQTTFEVHSVDLLDPKPGSV